MKKAKKQAAKAVTRVVHTPVVISPPKTISDIPVYCAYRQAVDIERVVPNPRNPNKHPDLQIALLAKIIKAQGWRAPIVVSNRSGYIVKGHARLEAAKLLQVAQVPIDYQDYANEAAEYADLLADNRLAELAENDPAMLKDMLLDLDTGDFDMDLTGFDAEALEKLMNQCAPPTRPGQDEQSGICSKCGRPM